MGERTRVSVSIELVPATWRDRVRILDNGCWEWTGYRVPGGYGYAGIGGRHEYVHREMFRRAVGVIPDGWTVDHRCHTKACLPGNDCPHRRCCNPQHLAAEPLADNVGRHWREQATCRQGHPLADFYGGRRRCRTCEYARIYAKRGKRSPLAVPNKPAE